MHLLKSATLITASETFQADLLIEGEKIAALYPPGLTPEHLTPDTQILDCTGKLILPGGVDPHCHFALPMFDTISSDDHYTGHKAAAFGGTTTVMDFVPQESSSPNEGEGVLAHSIALWHEKADPLAAIDFGFHMNITTLTPEVEAEIPHLLDLGIPTLKTFMAYNGRLRLHDGEIFRVLQIAKENGMLVMLHAENGDVIDNLIEAALARGDTSPAWHARTRPPWSAVDATFRGATLAAQAASSLYIVHMNAGGEVDMLQYARERGVPVMGETCPQYLFFTADHLAREDGAKWVCSPPMRAEADQERIWAGLKQGTLQTIGTDHCPFFYDGTTPILYEGEPIAIPGKELGLAAEGRHNDFTKIPNGLPAVGDRMPILWTYGVRAGRLTPNQFVSLTSTNPAKIFGLYPRKGALLPGSDADLVIWDPEKRVKYGVTHAQHRTDYNLFEGWELTGYPEKVFLRGQMIVDGDQWLGQKGMGQFLKRTTHQLL
ncbi:MAG: dihydropyrimidinase [Anaerolineales bacterium]|nr:dihydropyrimidinase [Anaerolineales bacterium]